MTGCICIGSAGAQHMDGCTSRRYGDLPGFIYRITFFSPFYHVSSQQIVQVEAVNHASEAAELIVGESGVEICQLPDLNYF